MVLIHPALLIGLALIAIPVILHLLMRAKPKKLVFPALRLIQNRRRTNVRRMRLRHFWLLLLRMAVIALLVFAVARPTVPAADYSLRWGDWLRLAGLTVGIAGAYFGLTYLWKQRQVPAHELAYRRSFLRAGLAGLALLAFLIVVAWPYERRIAAAITQPTIAPNEFVPAAAVMLFDTSLSMQYRHESRTRLEVAQEIAAKHIAGLPRQSRFAICDTAGDAAIRFQSDPSAAAKRVMSLAVQPQSRLVDDRLLAAVEAQIDDLERNRALDGGPSADLLREIYVFTDLAASAWRREESPRLKSALERMPGLAIYLIDVGVSTPTNLALTGLALSDQTVPMGNQVTLRATLEAAGVDPGEKLVELYVENASGKLVKQEQQAVRVEPSAASGVSFNLRAQAGPLMQGEVRVAASDPMAFDDARGFTLLVQPPPDVLIIGDSQDDAQYVLDALAPGELVQLGKAPYRCKFVTPGKAASENLSRYAIVCLVNVAAPPPALWNALAEFVSQGGGLAISLGDRVTQSAYLSTAARNVLPGELTRPFNFDPPEFLDLANLSHPILKRFADWDASGLTSAPIHRYWRVTPEHDAAVVTPYTDLRRGPAIVERAIGKGRVLLVTTSLDRSWNELPVPWQFVALVDQMMRYLSRTSQGVYNYPVGEDVLIPLDPGTELPAYLLRKPGLQQLRNDVPGGTTTLVIREADQLGNYRLLEADTDTKFARGFSVGAPAGESNLARLTKEELDSRLGADRYSVARDIENLQRNVRAGRLGREALPLIVLALLVAFVGESFVSNRFYDDEQRPAP